MVTNGGDAHVTSPKSGSSASDEATEFPRKHKQICLVVISKSRNKQAQVTNTGAHPVRTQYTRCYLQMRRYNSSSLRRQQHLLRGAAAAAAAAASNQPVISLSKNFTHVTFTITLITLPWTVCYYFLLVSSSSSYNQSNFKCTNLLRQFKVDIFLFFRCNSVCSFNYSLRFEFY